MHLRQRDLDLLLNEDRPLGLRRARGRRLLCVAGCAWVTLPGEPRDIYLYPGDGLTVATNALVLLEGMRNAHVRIMGDAVRGFFA